MYKDDIEDESNEFLKSDSDYYYSLYDNLVETFIKSYSNNNYNNVKIVIENSSKFLEENIPSKIINQEYFEKFTRELASEYFNHDKDNEEKIDELANVFYKFSGNIFNFASIYSLFYAFNDITRKLQNLIIMPEYIREFPAIIRQIIIEIFINNCTNKDEIRQDYLDKLLENDLCVIDTDSNQIFLTSKGINLMRTYSEMELIAEVEQPSPHHSNPDHAWNEIRTMNHLTL